MWKKFPIYTAMPQILAQGSDITAKCVCTSVGPIFEFFKNKPEPAQKDKVSSVIDIKSLILPTTN